MQRLTGWMTEPELLEIDDGVSAAQLGEYGRDRQAEGEGAVDAGLLDEDLDPDYAAVARAGAINRKLIENGTDLLPNGFVRLLSVSDDVTSVRRVCRRPMAIGVGGLSLRVDARTGEVEEIRLMGRDLPTPQALDDDESEDGRAIDAVPRSSDAEPGAGALPTPPDEDRERPTGSAPDPEQDVE
jgi:hypothetical protein